MSKKIASPTDDSAMQDPDGEATVEEVDTRTSEERMADRIAAGVAAGINAAQGPKKVPFSRFDPRTPWQKGTPSRAMPKLKRQCWQNGMRMDDAKMTAEEINLVNQIDTPGRYIDRLVEIIIRDDGPDSGAVWEMRYSDSRNHYMTLRGKVRVAKSASPLANMLHHILEESQGAVFSY